MHPHEHEHQQSEGSFQILPALTPQQQAQMQKEYREKLESFYNKNKKYEIDYWYPAIKEYTYQSFCFPVTVKEGYVLHCLYYDYGLAEEIKHAMDGLIARIDLLLAGRRNQRNLGRFFMKLSTRSPKDYCWDYRDQKQYEKAVQNLKQFLTKGQKTTKQTSPQKLNNSLYKFFLLNSHKKLLIRQGKDFIRIFSKSERIITDINDFSYLAGGLFEKIKEGTITQDEKNRKLVNVWVRDWEDCQWEQEFRTFYHQYKLTAISQYDQRCYFAGLVQRKQEIMNICLEIFEKIKPALQKIGLDQGVLDIVIKPDSVKVVEINVFDRDARASLFNWTKDENVLLNGPLQIRVLQKQVQISKVHLGSIMGMIDKRSINVITQALQQIGLVEIWK